MDFFHLKLSIQNLKLSWFWGKTGNTIPPSSFGHSLRRGTGCFAFPSPQRRRTQDEVAGNGAITDLTPTLSCKAREKDRVRDSNGKPDGFAKHCRNAQVG